MRKRNDTYIGEKRLLDTNELQTFLSMGRNNSMLFAKKIGAERKIGRRCLYDKAHINKYFDEISDEQQFELGSD